jgi:hypothetical protein
MEPLRMNRVANGLLALSTTLLAVVVGGCSAKTSTPSPVPTFPVAGKVTLKGQPVANARIRLHAIAGSSAVPIQAMPRGMSGEDGSFSLSTFKTNDGAPEGDYLVTISCPGPHEGKTEDMDEAPETLPVKYTRKETSGLMIHVAPVENQLSPFDLFP